MKKLFFLLILFMIGVAVFVNYSFRSIFDHGHNTSIRISEDGTNYKIYASYHRNKTHRLQRYMDQELHAKQVFENARIDGQITLDDEEKTHFYIQMYPGNLYIKLNKKENQFSAYTKMKQLGEGIKRKLADD